MVPRSSYMQRKQQYPGSFGAKLRARGVTQSSKRRNNKKGQSSLKEVRCAVRNKRADVQVFGCLYGLLSARVPGCFSSFLRVHCRCSQPARHHPVPTIVPALDQALRTTHMLQMDCGLKCGQCRPAAISSSPRNGKRNGEDITRVLQR